MLKKSWIAKTLF